MMHGSTDNHHTTMSTTPLDVESALASRVLHAARAAVEGSQPYADRNVWSHVGPKNQPLMPLLEALIDAATAVAKAIGDNAWDDCLPLKRDLAEGLASACYRLGADIQNAAQCPDASSWSLPSMTGKELV
jgi:hypothetical protein